MARYSRSSSQRPLWLAILVAVIAWAYQRYSHQPTQRETTQPRSTTRRTTTPRKDTGRRDTTKPRQAPPVEAGQIYQDVVEKVSDGDTVVLQRTGKVRLMGVDTPESYFMGKSQPGGEEAKAFAKQALDGKTVGVQLCAKQPTDRYGRSLGFIFITGRDGQQVLFNKEIIRMGYGRVLSIRPCSVDETEWNAAYEEARVARRGLFKTLGDVPDAVAFRRSIRGGGSGAETS